MPRFEVLRGIHSEGGKTYMVGDIVDSRSDLSKFNIPDGPQRYRVISDTENDSLDKLTVAELRKVAEEREVDISSATRRDQFINLIRASTTSSC